MFNQGLSLDQAPPISVVLRFFLSVPFFGVLFSLLLIVYPADVLIPNHPTSLSAMHLFFLGIISMSMIGSLFQMQSVLGGKPILSPLGNSLIIHLFFSVGLIALAGAFLFHLSAAFTIAAVLLGSSLIYLVRLILPLLFGGVTHDTLRGMRLALLSLLLTAVFGAVMANSFANESFEALHEAIRTAHYSLALAGWIGALVIAVAFQVVEMFYVTTAYGNWYKRNVFRTIALSLILKTLWLFLALPYIWVFDLFLAAVLLGFGVTTVVRLRNRKRRVSDISIEFWYAGMGLLFASLLSHIVYLYTASALYETTALLSFALFSLSIILGMMVKIVPFLVWFHLSSQGYLQTPIMSNIIPAKQNKRLFVLFGISSVLALLSFLTPVLLSLSGIGFFATFALLAYNLIGALRLYRHTKTTSPRMSMDFSSPS